MALSLAYLALVSFSLAGDWLAAPVDSFTRWAFALSFTAMVVVAGALLRLPLSYWRGFRYEHRWGFSTQSRAGWFADWSKGLAVQVVLMSLVMVGFVELVAAMDDSWPWAAAPAAAGLVAFLSFAQPVLIEPLFNKFKPLEDREFAGRLMVLAEKAGTPVRDILVADASRRTRRENAYVSGLGKTRRVVVFDTLLHRGSEHEVELIMAHELGHRADRHMLWWTILGAAGAVVAVVVLWVLLRSGAVLDAVGAGSAADPRVIPFVLLVADVLELLAMPAVTAISRRWEAAADRFGIRVTGDAQGYADMAKALGASNLADLTPSRPAYYLLFTHPSIPERIQAALDQR